MSATLPKLATPLAPLLTRLQWSSEAAKLVAGLQTAAEAVERLAAKGLNDEAVQLTAHALPKREAVWWACMCAQAVPDKALPAEDATARVAAEAWVRQPADEALRHKAWDAVQATGFQTPEALAASAAFFSGPSLSPQGQPAVPPADELTGRAVAGAVLLAAVRNRPEQAAVRLTRFLAAARDIAAGGAGRMPPEAP